VGEWDKNVKIIITSAKMNDASPIDYTGKDFAATLTRPYQLLEKSMAMKDAFR
jgi:hypothetical protein